VFRVLEGTVAYATLICTFYYYYYYYSNAGFIIHMHREQHSTDKPVFSKNSTYQT